MEILFVTREPEVCAVMSQRLATDEVHCAVQSDFLAFFLALQKQGVSCDLLICDFRQFQHLMGDVLSLLRDAVRPVPIIFYNDPYPCAEDRVVYWMSQNERLYEGSEWHAFSAVFSRLNDIIEDPLLRPYISLLRPPLPLTGSADTAPELSVDLLQFRMRNKVPPVIFSLFEYFYGNMSKEVSMKDISQRVFGGKYRRDSVYAYVSRLKKYIKADPLVKLDIIRSSLGRYQMIAC